MNKCSILPTFIFITFLISCDYEYPGSSSIPFPEDGQAINAWPTSFNGYYEVDDLILLQEQEELKKEVQLEIENGADYDYDDILW